MELGVEVERPSIPIPEERVLESEPRLARSVRLFSQGDLSVGEYYRQMNGLADSLRDLGEPVADRTLVLNLLRGLNPRYSHLKALIDRKSVV